MAVRIRLKRTGRKNRPFYRICVFDARTRRDGAPVEELGSYDPRGVDWDAKIRLNRKRAHYWLTVGALPSETVASILRRFGVRKDGPAPEDEVLEPVAVATPAEATPDAAPAAGAAPVAAAPVAVSDAAPEAEAVQEGGGESAAADAPAAEGEKPQADTADS
jgi:small subunit ribosomal protein S16